MDRFAKLKGTTMDPFINWNLIGSSLQNNANVLLSVLYPAFGFGL